MIKIFTENSLACLFLLTAYDPRFQNILCRHFYFICMLFSAFSKFLNNIKCLFSWKNSVQSVKSLVIPYLLQLQIFINKIDTKNLLQIFPAILLVVTPATHNSAQSGKYCFQRPGLNYKLDFKLHFCLMWLWANRLFSLSLFLHLKWGI